MKGKQAVHALTESKSQVRLQSQKWNLESEDKRGTVQEMEMTEGLKSVSLTMRDGSVFSVCFCIHHQQPAHTTSSVKTEGLLRISTPSCFLYDSADEFQSDVNKSNFSLNL